MELREKRQGCRQRSVAHTLGETIARIGSAEPPYRYPAYRPANLRMHAACFLTALTAAGLPLVAQESLLTAVEQTLAAEQTADFDRRLEALQTRADASGDALFEALTRRPPLLRGDERIVVPVGGQQIEVKMHAPPQREADRPLPLLLIVNWSSQPLHDAVYDHVITAEMPDYHPPQFSDEGRDAHAKILRTVAYRAGGDPDSLWFTGYSWGGHACWDDALHRPGLLRGFIGRGGGPRRTTFRLLPNLASLRVLAVCGGKDDPELVWNLREVLRDGKELGFAIDYWEDPESGHDQPLPGEYEGGMALLATAPAGPPPARGVLLADGPHVEHPLFRIDEVDASKCAIPDRIAVSPRLSADEQRRATLRAMAGAVASVAWEITTKQGVKTITLHGKGVRRGQLSLREPWFARGDQVRVVVGGRTLFQGELTVEPRALLGEARRTGERLRPALRTVDMRF